MPVTLMIKVLVVSLLASMVSIAALAQSQNKVKLVDRLTEAECATITRLSGREYMVKGPVMIGQVRLADTNVQWGTLLDGVDPWFLITISCFPSK
jgi:hypothetical protein